MTKKNYVFLILLLGTLSAVAPFSIDMYLPGFPAIAKDLHTSIEQVALSLSSFFIGISAGQLLYGPLLDRFGRKPPLYAGLLLYFFASLGCSFASSIETLVLLRFVQAIGCCACGVAAMAMVRDLFPVEESAKVFSLLVLVLGVSPMIAPTVGGYLTAAFGWPVIFIVLTVMAGLILLGVYFGLPESRLPDPSISLKPLPIINNFLSVIKDPQFCTYALAGGIAFAGLFAYISGSPGVFMELFKTSEKLYGWIFALLSVGFIGSSQLNSLLLKKFKSEQIIVTALICQCITAFTFVIATMNGWTGLVGTISLLFLFLCCLGFIFPNATALSLAPFTKNAGSASALMGALQMGLGSLATVAVSLLNNHTALPMVGTMAVCSTLALGILFAGNWVLRSRINQPSL